MEKPDPGLIHLLEETLEDFECVRRRMFGCPVWFTPGSAMFAGVFGSSIFIRLGATDRKQLLAEHGDAGPFDPLGGRPMKEYVVLPNSHLEDEGFLAGWLGKSYAFAGSLPPIKKHAV